MTILLSRRTALASLIGAAATPVLARPALAQRGSREPEVPFVPTPHSLVQKMLDLAALTPSDYLIDLGCGDGRIAVAAGQRGARAMGVDIDALRVREAAAAARVAGVTSRVHFLRQDLFQTPIWEAQVVALYLLPAINLRLRPKLLTELQPGARVVSHAFDMADWAPDAEETHDGRRIFLWIVPGIAEGQWTLTMADGSTYLLALEQRFQAVTGEVSGGGRSVPVTGRLAGNGLTLASADGAFRLDGRIEGQSLAPADAAAGWQALRMD